MKRSLAALAIALTAMLSAGAGAATAAPNPNKPVPNPPDSFTLTNYDGSRVCSGFDVTAQVTGKSKLIALPGDRFTAISPGATVTLTVKSGTSLRYVITGALRFQSISDGGLEVKATGRNLLTVPRTADHPEGLFLTTGNVNFALNSDGSERRLFSGSGQVTDVCALLAR